MVLALPAILLLKGCSDPHSPETTTKLFLRAFAETGSTYRADFVAPLRIEFSSPDGIFRYRHSLDPTHRFFTGSSLSAKQRSEMLRREATLAALTLPFVARTTPAFSDPAEVGALFAKVHESLHSCKAIEIVGDLRHENLSTVNSGQYRRGSTRYVTRSQFRHRGWTLFDFHPLIQTWETPPSRRVEIGKRAYLDGVLVNATERSGTSTDLEQLRWKREAIVSEAPSGFTVLNWDNGRSPFLAFYEILGKEGSVFFSAEESERHAGLNIAIEPRGEQVELSIVAGLLDNGFTRTVLLLDPAKGYALVSARTEMSVAEDLTPGIEHTVEANDFAFIESPQGKLHYPTHHRFEVRSGDSFRVKGEHRISGIRLLSGGQRSDFEVPFDDSWTVIDRRGQVTMTVQVRDE